MIKGCLDGLNWSLLHILVLSPSHDSNVQNLSRDCFIMSWKTSNCLDNSSNVVITFSCLVGFCEGASTSRTRIEQIFFWISQNQRLLIPICYEPGWLSGIETEIARTFFPCGNHPFPLRWTEIENHSERLQIVPEPRVWRCRKPRRVFKHRNMIKDLIETMTYSAKGNL